MPINTLCNLGPNWLRIVVCIVLTRFKTAIYNNSRANKLRVTHYRTHPRSFAYKYFVQLWARLIEKCCVYCANKVKNSNIKSFRANYSGVTKRISLTIKLFRDLVSINTSCKFGSDWLRNVVSIALTTKLTDARTTYEPPWHKPLWPLASGAKNVTIADCWNAEGNHNPPWFTLLRKERLGIFRRVADLLLLVKRVRLNGHTL